jgi:hypothetical protein
MQSSLSVCSQCIVSLPLTPRNPCGVMLPVSVVAIGCRAWLDVFCAVFVVVLLVALDFGRLHRCTLRFGGRLADAAHRTSLE